MGIIKGPSFGEGISDIFIRYINKYIIILRNQYTNIIFKLIIMSIRHVIKNWGSKKYKYGCCLDLKSW